MKRIVLFFLIFLLSSNAYSETAKGYVFIDNNGNSMFDNSDEGVSNIAISNGIDIVQTDVNGYYEIQIESGQTLFSIKPSGVEFIASNKMTNKNYFNYFPTGSPSLDHKGVDATGELPDFINFEIKRTTDNLKEFKVLLFGDSQTRNSAEVNFLAHSSMEQSFREEVVFGVTLGDVVFDNLSIFPYLLESMSAMNKRWYYVMGNHDINFDTKDQNICDDTWNSLLGPSYYSFNYGKVHFIALNDIRYDGEKKYHAGLGEQQLKFIENDLSIVPQDYLIVLMMHIPLVELEDLEELFALLKGRKTLSFSAHWHMNQHFFMGDDYKWAEAGTHHHIICGATCGSWWNGEYDIFGIPQSMMRCGSPKGYWIAEFNESDYKIEFVPVDIDPNKKMSIWTYEKNVRDENLNEFWSPRKDSVFVNVFAGNEKTKVMAKIGNGEWFDIEKVVTSDPYYDRLILMQKRKIYPTETSLNYWSKEPVMSEHIWGFKLPENIESGAHLIEVSAKDEFGLDAKGFRIFVSE